MSKSERLTRMLDSGPDYYTTSDIFRAILEAQGDEYDSIEAKKNDLALQGNIMTATWGLRYYEDAYNIPIIETDGYEIRRSRVLAKRRSPGNFSAALIQSVCESFINGQVSVRIDMEERQVSITYIGVRGLPPNTKDLEAAVDNLIHAHLGVKYVVTFLTWDEAEAQRLTWNLAETLTWDQLERAFL